MAETNINKTNINKIVKEMELLKYSKEEIRQVLSIMKICDKNYNIRRKEYEQVFEKV